MWRAGGAYSVYGFQVSITKSRVGYTWCDFHAGAVPNLTPLQGLTGAQGETNGKSDFIASGDASVRNTWSVTDYIANSIFSHLQRGKRRLHTSTDKWWKRTNEHEQTSS